MYQIKKPFFSFKYLVAFIVQLKLPKIVRDCQNLPVYCFHLKYLIFILIKCSLEL